MVLSLLPEATLLPSGEKVTELMPPLWAKYVKYFSSLHKFQSLTDLSKLPETKVSPLGDISIEFTSSECPSSVCKHFEEFMSHILIVES